MDCNVQFHIILKETEIVCSFCDKQLEEHSIQISPHDKNKVIKIFAEIVKTLAILNGQRKRMINLKFIQGKHLKC